MMAAASERVEYRKRIRASELTRSPRSVSGSLTRTVLVMVNLVEGGKRCGSDGGDGDNGALLIWL